MRRALISLAALGASLLPPSAALAAFELRDASPAALGAVSIDLESQSMLDGAEPRLGVRLGASHASLYQVDGLVQDRAWAEVEGRRGSASLALARVGVPGAEESSARLTLRESGSSAIALELSAERLDLALDEAPPEGGWALGGAARARVPLPRLDLEVVVAADRVLQSAGLDRLAVPPSVPFSIRLRSGGAAAAWVDRWDGGGRRSPRLVLDLPVTGAARLRLGRGEAPGRIGAALAIRWRRIEVSAGRMDQSAGGVITSVAVRLAAAGAPGGPRAGDGGR
ncbi:MAG TPA: hypothetical protein VJQ53_02820 [Candidatus Eisenbacteria bacterium]|nr:hypothetical protein [Candidatus Eisenbacteria bacterium]